MALVAYLFGRTSIGTAMRAVAESADTARILGLGSQRIARIAWALGLGLAALAAFLYAPGPDWCRPCSAHRCSAPSPGSSSAA